LTKKRIVITGAPGTGKTSIILKLESANFFCFHEVIRTMTQEAKKNNGNTNIVSNPIVSVEDPYTFNTSILNARIQQHRDASLKKDSILFYDRGIPDVLAYMDYFKQSYTEQFIKECRDHIYDHVFILPPWEKIYVRDEERYESFEQAQEIHHHLVATYNKLGYNCIEVPFGSVAERNNFILKTVQ